MTPTEKQPTAEAIAGFWSKARTNPDNGCLEWDAALTSAGYGSVRWGARVASAHRVAFTLSHGAIAPGLIIRHRCNNPKCVHPGHLVAGTHADNSADWAARGIAATPSLPLSVRDREDIIGLAEAKRSGLCPWATFGALAEIFDVCRDTIAVLLRKHRAQEAAKQSTAA